MNDIIKCFICCDPILEGERWQKANIPFVAHWDCYDTNVAEEWEKWWDKHEADAPQTIEQCDWKND